MNPETSPPSDKLLLKVAVLFVILAAGGAIFLYVNRDWSAPAAAKNLQNPVRATDESIALGMQIYSTRCQHCHGERGNGKGERAGDLSIAPSDFTDSHAMGLVSDGELFWKISHGRRPMPSFQDKLSEQERWELVDFIRTFAQRPGTGVAPAAN
ncbi:MAG TPA: cytochrome c [Candidatus Acidoferrales bacterium]|jgi:mono/diheme cytochrome c family protein